MVNNPLSKYHGRQVRCFPDLVALSRAAAAQVAAVINAAVHDRGRCHIALAGGKTPAMLYQQLATPPLSQQIPWDKVECWFGDERVVPLDHAESNYRLARETLLSKVPIPANQIHPMIDDPAQPQQQAQRYEELLRASLPQQMGTPCFDLILLGMGADGHTASLFPGLGLLQEQQRSVVAGYVEKLAAWRISLTMPVLNAAQQVIVLVCGADKAQTLHEVFTNPNANLPIQQLSVRDEVLWFVDEAAYSSSIELRHF